MSLHLSCGGPLSMTRDAIEEDIGESVGSALIIGIAIEEILITFRPPPLVPSVANRPLCCCSYCRTHHRSQIGSLIISISFAYSYSQTGKSLGAQREDGRTSVRHHASAPRLALPRPLVQKRLGFPHLQVSCPGGEREKVVCAVD